VPYEDTELLYGTEGNDLMLAGASKGTLVFRGQAPNGFVVTKSLTFSGSNYPIQLEVSVKAADGSAPAPEILLAEKSDHTVPNPMPFLKSHCLVNNKISREPPPEE
jgi:hypothetical protein